MSDNKQPKPVIVVRLIFVALLAVFAVSASMIHPANGREYVCLVVQAVSSYLVGVLTVLSFCLH